MQITSGVRAQIAELVERASMHPLDYRQVSKVLDAEALLRVIQTRRLVIGPVVLTYTHDLLPPDWVTYRHLAVTLNGQRPDDALFAQIAAEVGMGDRTIWLDNLAQVAEQVSSKRVKHAFARVGGFTAAGP